MIGSWKREWCGHQEKEASALEVHAEELVSPTGAACEESIEPGVVPALLLSLKPTEVRRPEKSPLAGGAARKRRTVWGASIIEEKKKTKA